MKKLTLFLLLTICTPVFAETFFEPNWSEFCPYTYQNLDSSKEYFLATKKYWASRKQIFESRLEKCNSLPEKKRGACYENLRNIEMKASELRNEREKTNALYYDTRYYERTKSY